MTGNVIVNNYVLFISAIILFPVLYGHLSGSHGNHREFVLPTLPTAAIIIIIIIII
jgi:hypothetical protein